MNLITERDLVSARLNVALQHLEEAAKQLEGTNPLNAFVLPSAQLTDPIDRIADVLKAVAVIENSGSLEEVTRRTNELRQQTQSVTEEAARTAIQNEQLRVLIAQRRANHEGSSKNLDTIKATTGPK